MISWERTFSRLRTATSAIKRYRYIVLYIHLKVKMLVPTKMVKFWALSQGSDIGTL